MPAPTIEIDLHTVNLTCPCAEVLSPEEFSRAGRFRFEEDRVRWTRAHSALRTILGESLTQNPGALAFVENEHGKPALRDFPRFHFNLSHAGDFAMIAVSSVAPVGVDIERVRARVDIGALLRRLGEEDLPTAEFELYQRWTAREAATKAAGSPLFTKPGRHIRVQPLIAPPGYAASVAVDAGCEIGDIIVRIKASA